MRPTNGQLMRLGLAVAATWALATAVRGALRDVTGGSMRPALHPGDRVLVLPAHPPRLRRGDVVVMRDPRRPVRETIKRVVGLPGERVALAGRRLTVDGARYAEPYARGPTGSGAAWDVPAGHVVVLGDNRPASTDSRAYGPVPLSHLVGRVALRVRPPGRAPHRRPHPVRDDS